MSLELFMPDVYKKLLQVKKKLEAHYRDVCDIEFTIENGELFILNVRPAKRTSLANLRFLIQFYIEGKIALVDVLTRVELYNITDLVKSDILNRSSLIPLGCALPASPGAATGKIALDAATAIELTREGHRVIFVKDEVSPEDIEAIHLAQGVLTKRGGMTSHAAVVCRGMEKPCVAGFGQIHIQSSKQVSIDDWGTLNEKDWITIDGTTGHAYAGKGKIAAHNWRDQPELMAFAQLAELAIIKREIPLKCMGKIWKIRDFFVHSLPLLHTNTSKQPVSNQPFVSFIPPRQETLQKVRGDLNTILAQDNDNYRLILLSLAGTLSRLLSSAVGLGQHHRYFRPLWDPKKCVVRVDQSNEKQFIGFEFFGINCYVPHLVDIATITFLIDVEVEEETDEWFLDFTNPDGESLVSASEKVTGFTLFVNDAIVSYEDLPFFYDSFRIREYYWRFYESNHTSYQEIVDFLRIRSHSDSTISPLLSLCFELGLFRDGTLTCIGESLLGKLSRSHRYEFLLQ